jgi:MFS family permease
MLTIDLGLRAGSSLASGVAWSAHVLIAARAAQGLSAAIIAPAALSLVITTFPEGPERNKALGVWGALGGVGVTTRLLLGGAITAGLGWRWIFIVNLPIALGVLALTPGVLTKDAGRGGSRRFDLAGALTITAALLLLAFAIITIPTVGWTSAQTVGLLGAATALLALFAYIETHTRVPLLPGAVLRSPGLIGGTSCWLRLGWVSTGCSSRSRRSPRRLSGTRRSSLGWWPRS